MSSPEAERPTRRAERRERDREKKDREERDKGPPTRSFDMAVGVWQGRWAAGIKAIINVDTYLIARYFDTLARIDLVEFRNLGACSTEERPAPVRRHGEEEFAAHAGSVFANVVEVANLNLAEAGITPDYCLQSLHHFVIEPPRPSSPAALELPVPAAPHTILPIGSYILALHEQDPSRFLLLRLTRSSRLVYLGSGVLGEGADFFCTRKIDEFDDAEDHATAETVTRDTPFRATNIVIFGRPYLHYALAYDAATGAYIIISLVNLVNKVLGRAPSNSAGDHNAHEAIVIKRAAMQEEWSDIVWKGTPHRLSTRNKFFCYNALTGETAFEVLHNNRRFVSLVEGEHVAYPLKYRNELTRLARATSPSSGSSKPTTPPTTGTDGNSTDDAEDAAMRRRRLMSLTPCHMERLGERRRGCIMIPMVLAGQLGCLLYSHNYLSVPSAGRSTGRTPALATQDLGAVWSNTASVDAASAMLQKRIFAHEEPWSHCVFISDMLAHTMPAGIHQLYLLSYSAISGIVWLSSIYQISTVSARTGNDVVLPSLSPVALALAMHADRMGAAVAQAASSTERIQRTPQLPRSGKTPASGTGSGGTPSRTRLPEPVSPSVMHRNAMIAASNIITPRRPSPPGRAPTPRGGEVLARWRMSPVVDDDEEVQIYDEQRDELLKPFRVKTRIGVKRSNGQYETQTRVTASFGDSRRRLSAGPDTVPRRLSARRSTFDDDISRAAASAAAASGGRRRRIGSRSASLQSSAQSQLGTEEERAEGGASASDRDARRRRRRSKRASSVSNEDASGHQEDEGAEDHDDSTEVPSSGRRRRRRRSRSTATPEPADGAEDEAAADEEISKKRKRRSRKGSRRITDSSAAENAEAQEADDDHATAEEDGEGGSQRKKRRSYRRRSKHTGEPEPESALSEQEGADGAQGLATMKGRRRRGTNISQVSEGDDQDTSSGRKARRRSARRAGSVSSADNNLNRRTDSRSSAGRPSSGSWKQRPQSAGSRSSGTIDTAARDRRIKKELEERQRQRRRRNEEIRQKHLRKQREFEQKQRKEADERYKDEQERRKKMLDEEAKQAQARRNEIRAKQINEHRRREQQYRESVALRLASQGSDGGSSTRRRRRHQRSSSASSGSSRRVTPKAKQRASPHRPSNRTPPRPPSGKRGSSASSRVKEAPIHTKEEFEEMRQQRQRMYDTAPQPLPRHQPRPPTKSYEVSQDPDHQRYHPPIKAAVPRFDPAAVRREEEERAKRPKFQIPTYEPRKPVQHSQRMEKKLAEMPPVTDDFYQDIINIIKYLQETELGMNSKAAEYALGMVYDLDPDEDPTRSPNAERNKHSNHLNIEPWRGVGERTRDIDAGGLTPPARGTPYYRFLRSQEKHLADEVPKLKFSDKTMMRLFKPVHTREEYQAKELAKLDAKCKRNCEGKDKAEVQKTLHRLGVLDIDIRKSNEEVRRNRMLKAEQKDMQKEAFRRLDADEQEKQVQHLYVDSPRIREQNLQKTIMLRKRAEAKIMVGGEARPLTAEQEKALMKRLLVDPAVSASQCHIETLKDMERNLPPPKVLEEEVINEAGKRLFENAKPYVHPTVTGTFTSGN